MKVRNGFVSNSSSLSFTCDICNTVESGWDLSILDINMIYCENDHLICCEHLNHEIQTKLSNSYIWSGKSTENNNEYDYKNDPDFILDDYQGLKISSKNCPLCTLDKPYISESTLFKYLVISNKYDINKLKEKFCNDYTSLKQLEEDYKKLKENK